MFVIKGIRFYKTGSGRVGWGGRWQEVCQQNFYEKNPI